MAVASPPPMHSDAMPRFRPRALSAYRSVVVIRAPDAPIGWPSEIPLPFGLPSSLCRFRWGETEYGIGVLPLGGYVKMGGDDPRDRENAQPGDFFVAGRALPGAMVFVTLLAANIGAGSTVGAAGLGYRHGLSAWWWSGSAAIGCLVLGLVVAPRMHCLAKEHGFFTVGDFLEWRFDRSVRVLIATILWLGTAALLSGQLIAMAWAFEVIAGAAAGLGRLGGVPVFLGGDHSISEPLTCRLTTSDS